MKKEISINENYLLVHIDGNVEYNIDGILSKLLDKSIFDYIPLSDRVTLLSPKYFHGSFLYHSLISMINNSTTTDDKWFKAEFIRSSTNGDSYNGIVDTVFYDEFMFLISEDFIRFDNCELLTEEDIWHNYEASTIEKNDVTKPLYEAKTLSELKSFFNILVNQYHPDKTGSDNDIIRTIINVYTTQRKRIK